jgi:hypothetical protein
MMMKRFSTMFSAVFAVASLLSFSSSASRAGIVITVEAPGVQASTLAGGVITETFDSYGNGSYTSINSSIGTYTAPSPGLAIVKPDDFGGAFQTQYMSVGAQSTQTSATLTFNSSQNYFGLYWAALDAQNSVQVFNGATLLATIDETTLNPMLLSTGGPNGLGHYGNPNTGADTSEAFVYVNITTTGNDAITSIDFLNNGTGTGFESDNHSLRAVPEPSSIVALSIGSFAVLGAGIRRRIKARQPRLV